MRKSFILVLLVLVLAAAPALAGGLVEQGDRAMAGADYRSAAAIYARALAADPGNPEITDKLEQAMVAKRCHGLLSRIDREVQKKGDIRISARQLVTLMRAGEKVTLIDVRTPQERAFVIPTKAISIQIPEIMNNLGRIPHDGVVVIICHSGPRAIIVTTALRIAGYDNVYALKGGIMSIADINAKKAPDEMR